VISDLALLDAAIRDRAALGRALNCEVALPARPYY